MRVPNTGSEEALPSSVNLMIDQIYKKYLFHFINFISCVLKEIKWKYIKVIILNYGHFTNGCRFFVFTFCYWAMWCINC